MKDVNCEVIRVEDQYVILENKANVWWLGSRSTFQLPKDEKLANAKQGDIVTITLRERN